jgi:hypothetical protein
VEYHCSADEDFRLMVALKRNCLALSEAFAEQARELALLRAQRNVSVVAESPKGFVHRREPEFSLSEYSVSFVGNMPKAYATEVATVFPNLDDMEDARGFTPAQSLPVNVLPLPLPCFTSREATEGHSAKLGKY